MRPEIKTIRFALPLNLGSVNCYLVNTRAGYVLIDTGASNQRAELERELESAGCHPGDLSIIVLTHGDFDHTGNAAYLGEKYGAKIAMPPDDSGMLERGDMFWNRKKGNLLIRMLAPILFRFGAANRCEPDITIQEGCDLSGYGFDDKVLDIPGHSKGSIGILVASGAPSKGQALFCGDLLDNINEPGLNSIVDDSVEAGASLNKLKSLAIHTVYPGHGKPFAGSQLSSLG
ncbi:MAG: MBL fold metallo-hydrolase [Anaerolineales bacterium]|jgi:hydroxyacylglutathione hydrolase